MNPVKQYMALYEARIRSLTEGAPALAKTDMHRQAAENLGFTLQSGLKPLEGKALVIHRMGGKDRFDIQGCAFPDHGRQVTAFYEQEVIRNIMDSRDEVYLVCDELGQLDLDAAGPFARWFDKGYFPDHVHIVATTNGVSHRAGSHAINEMIKSRLGAGYAMPDPPDPNKSAASSADKVDGPVTLCTWGELAESWSMWAARNSIHPSAKAYHQATNGLYLYDWKPNPSPSVRYADFRQWVNVSHACYSGMEDHNTIGSLIGKANAGLFIQFLSLRNSMPSIDDVFRSPDTTAIPSDVSTQWLLFYTLASRAQRRDVDAFFRYTGRVDNPVMRVFAGISLKTTVEQRDKAKGLSDLVHMKPWIEFANKHEHLMW